MSSFDERKTWDDDPAKVERARTVAAAISGSIGLTSSTRMLEYGAGAGLVSQALTDQVAPSPSLIRQPACAWSWRLK